MLESVNDTVHHVGSEVLRKVPFGALVDAMAADFQFRVNLPNERDGSNYDEVAAIYLRAVSERRNPTRAVADELGISKSAAGKRVFRARQRGLLPRTQRGRPRGADVYGITTTSGTVTGKKG